MKKFLLIVCLALALSLCCVAFAASGLLTDRAELLDSWEEERLTERLEEITDETGVAVVVVTVDGLDGKSVRSYADDWLNHGGYGNDGVLLLIDMDSRQWYISTAGYGMTAISDASAQRIGDRVAPYLGDEEYYDGLCVFADGCEDYILRAQSGQGEPQETESAVPGLETLGICVLIGFVISLIVALCLKAQLKSVRSKPDASSYVRAGSMVVTQSHDMYLYSNTVRTARPKNNSSGHSGGRSNGGAGGRF